jgi:hypothetical protein
MKRFVYLFGTLFLMCGSALAQSQPNDATIVRPPAVACPMIAKLCPDGTSVSPQGPNCEFPPCPGGGDGRMKVAPPGPPTTACTMDAKKCPDGSWVSRTGHNCEFAPCPGEKSDNGDATEDQHQDKNKGDSDSGGASSGSGNTGEEDAAPPIYVTPDKSPPAKGDSNGE